VSRTGHRGIRGSAALATARVDPAAVPAETLEPGELRRVPFGGELLGAVRVRTGFAAIPLDAFDRAGELLDAEAQAAYLQLLRLSVAEGRNFCRVAKRDLMARLRLSERRLLGVLDAVVAAGFARPLHRDNRGTLWRVFLPAEAAGRPVGNGVLLGRAVKPALRVAPRSSPAAPTPATAPTPAPAPAVAAASGPAAPASLEELARALARARGRADGDGFAAALGEVRELVAEGQRPARIAAAIETIRRRAAAPGSAGAGPGAAAQGGAP